jgi:hypothetical protein
MKRVLLAGVAAGFAGAVALRRARNWGAEPGELIAELPGDDLIPDPAEVTTRAVDIDAPADRVWRWLVQMGQDRGGMYSYDWLETVFGLRIYSVNRVHERWQHLAVGDRIELVPKGWGPLPDGYALTVARIDPGRALVLRQAPPEHPWNAVWTFVLEPLDATSCRLLSRSRAERPTDPRMRMANAVLEPITTIMTRRMLIGIKQRAEAEAPTSEPELTRPVHDVATVLDATPTTSGGAS